MHTKCTEAVHNTHTHKTHTQKMHTKHTEDAHNTHTHIKHTHRRCTQNTEKMHTTPTPQFLTPGTYGQRSLQFASGDAEAVEDHVLPHTVDPLASGGKGCTHKVSPFSLTAGETPHNLHTEVQQLPH